jgi:hypothetical protein
VTFTGASNSLLDLTGTTLAQFHGIVTNLAADQGILALNAASVALDSTGKILTVFDSAHASLASITFATSLAGNNMQVVNGDEIVICFMPGTLISTPFGLRAVETFKANDLVLTIDGRAAPVRWVGRQTVSRIFGDPLRVLPIRIKAGALDEIVPCQDLLVSPDHALLINDVLLQAGALINGVSIVRETNVPPTYTYYPVELDDHSLILAEGVPAETFVDNVDRLAFDNWHEHEMLYPNGKAIVEMQYPRAKSHRQVPQRLRARLADRGAELYGSKIQRAG